MASVTDVPSMKLLVNGRETSLATPSGNFWLAPIKAVPGQFPLPAFESAATDAGGASMDPKQLLRDCEPQPCGQEPVMEYDECPYYRSCT